MECLCRYFEMNVRSSSLYRKYNDDVPQYLRNRPRRLIDDMRKKMMSLEPLVAAGVRMKSHGVFLVPARGARPSHEVVFGDKSTFCSCTCQSFERTQLLCTHFCAVFRAFPDWSFERVSPLYTESPLLKLDEDILQAGTISPLTSSTISSQPKLVGPNRLKADKQKARSLLRNVFELTYKISDVTVLQNLVQSLEPIQKKMSESVSTQIATHESASTGSTLLPTDSSVRKRKLEFKRYMLPQKKRTSEESPQVNVIEVHVIDGSYVADVTACGPTFTV